VVIAFHGDAAERHPAMFTPEQYRSKADEYTELAKSAATDDERHEFQKLQRSFAVMADNEQWLADNHNQTVHPLAPPQSAESADRPLPSQAQEQ
jgi:hypothetical protein